LYKQSLSGQAQFSPQLRGTAEQFFPNKYKSHVIIFGWFALAGSGGGIWVSGLNVTVSLVGAYYL
jgi:hypothetical protein